MILYLLFVVAVYAFAESTDRGTVMTDFNGVTIGVYCRPATRVLYVFLIPCVGVRWCLK